MKHISEPVRKIFQHFSMPTGLYETIYNPNNEYRFGHMSGGVDKDAKAFISIYGGLEKNNCKWP